MKNIFLLTAILSLFSLSSCEKISNLESKISSNIPNISNPFHKLSEWDKKISKEFLNEKTYQWNIDLSWLWLTKIPDFPKYLTWTNADKITSISLNANKIIKIDWEKFKNFLNLKELDLSFNQIKNTKWIDKIPSKILSKLELTKSWVEKIDWIWKLKSLNQLFLSFNKIEKTEWLENLKNLQYLELTHNKLENIDNLADLNNLTDLKIEFNKIKNVDKILNNEKSKLQMFTMKFNEINAKIVNAVETNNQKVYKLRHVNDKKNQK